MLSVGRRYRHLCLSVGLGGEQRKETPDIARTDLSSGRAASRKAARERDMLSYLQRFGGILEQLSLDPDVCHDTDFKITYRRNAAEHDCADLGEEVWVAV